jgi:hypothetical protein
MDLLFCSSCIGRIIWVICISRISPAHRGRRPAPGVDSTPIIGTTGWRGREAGLLA